MICLTSTMSYTHVTMSLPLTRCLWLVILDILVKQKMSLVVPEIASIANKMITNIIYH